MDLNGIPLFSLLQNKLGYLNERQRLIAQNVANSSTPGFTPKDLKAFTEQPGLKSGPSAKPVAMIGAVTTDPAHLTSKAMGTDDPKAVTYVSMASPDSETTLDGNQVVLEEQMMKMSEARNDYDAAVGFYQKAVAMLHMAVQKPGG
jgi:flagellar basal-body rod protein FlgB